MTELNTFKDIGEKLIQQVAVFFKDTYKEAIKEENFRLDLDNQINELHKEILNNNFAHKAVSIGLKFIETIREKYIIDKESKFYDKGVFYAEVNEKLLCFLYDYYEESISEYEKLEIEEIVNGKDIFLGNEISISDATWKKYKKYKIKNSLGKKDILDDTYTNKSSDFVFSSVINTKVYKENGYLGDTEILNKEYNKNYRENLIKMVSIELELINEINNENGKVLKKSSLDETKLSFIQKVQRKINRIEPDESILMSLERYKPKDSQMNPINKVIQINKSECFDNNKQESIDFSIDGNICNTLAQNKFILYENILSSLNKMDVLIKSLQIENKVVFIPKTEDLNSQKFDLMKKRNGNLQEKNLYVINLVVDKAISKHVEEIIKLYLEHLVYGHISAYRKTEFDINKLGTSLREIVLREILEKNISATVNRKKI